MSQKMIAAPLQHVKIQALEIRFQTIPADFVYFVTYIFGHFRSHLGNRNMQNLTLLNGYCKIILTWKGINDHESRKVQKEFLKKNHFYGAHTQFYGSKCPKMPFFGHNSSGIVGKWFKHNMNLIYQVIRTVWCSLHIKVFIWDLIRAPKLMFLAQNKLKIPFFEHEFVK